MTALRSRAGHSYSRTIYCRGGANVGIFLTKSTSGSLSRRPHFLHTQRICALQKCCYEAGQRAYTEGVARHANGCLGVAVVFVTDVVFAMAFRRMFRGTRTVGRGRSEGWKALHGDGRSPPSSPHPSNPSRPVDATPQYSSPCRHLLVQPPPSGLFLAWI